MRTAAIHGGRCFDCASCSGASHTVCFLPQTARDRKRRQVGSARNERRRLRRAYAHYQEALDAWAERQRERLTQGWVHPHENEEAAPEFHGDHTQAVVRTADGAEVVFILLPTASAAAGAASGLATDDDSAAAEHTWRIRSGKASGPPPPNPDSQSAPLQSEALKPVETGNNPWPDGSQSKPGLHQLQQLPLLRRRDFAP